MTDARPARALDTSALTARIDPAAFRAYLRNSRGSGSSVLGPGWNPAALSLTSGAGFGILAVCIGMFVVVGVLGSTLRNGSAVFLVIVVLVVVLVFGGLVWSGVAARRHRYRLAGFAAANGMDFEAQVPNPSEPGLIFQLGGSRVAWDLVEDPERGVDVANYRYTTGSGRSRTTHRWGYLELRLENPLPNIVLDATSNNTLFGSNLPETLDRHQRLHLEGDFDKHFTLYCPAGYEQDALYLFTPDIMARFIDDAATLDVEIVDDRLFLYAQRDLSTVDPATWIWLFSIVDALHSKLAQWARWRDDRLASAASVASSPVAATTATFLRPPPGVAIQGRRLRRGISWTSIVVFLALILFWVGQKVLEHLHP